jgi:hypothetical protein
MAGMLWTTLMMKNEDCGNTGESAAGSGGSATGHR